MANNKQRNNKILELAVSVFFILVSIYMIYVAQTTGMPTTDGSMSSMAFPRAMYIVIILLCTYLVVMNLMWFKKNPKDPNAEKVSFIPRKSVLTFIFICVYAALWNVIGFTASTLLFFLAEAYMLDRKRPFWLTLLIAVCACVLMYVVFGMMFKVAFPDPLMDMLRGF
ncbi:MAG: tripartite tricarboxylate transporter TctB family protein [Candidatus Heteroscillospira sp.]|jgi:hypothetical protein